MQLCYKSYFPDYYRHTIHQRLKVRCCFTTKDVAIDALDNDNTVRVLCALHCLFSPIYCIAIVMKVYELIQYTAIKSQLLAVILLFMKSFFITVLNYTKSINMRISKLHFEFRQCSLKRKCPFYEKHLPLHNVK